MQIFIGIFRGKGYTCNRTHMLLTRKWIISAATALTLGALNSGYGATDSDPVLDLLLQKGMITEAEAAKVKSQLDARQTNAPPQFPKTKWEISDGIKNVQLFGDLRLRFEDRSAVDPAGGKINLDRLRFSFRAGLRGEAYDDFYYGFRLDTAANPRSPWVTFGSSASGTPYQGPFGKSTGGIDVGQLYLGWRPADWIDLTAGKMPQPLYTTSMVWDSDYQPEGLAEHFKYKVGDADLFANFGQFIYEDTNPTDTSPGYFGIGNLYPSQNGSSSSPVFLLAWQLGVKYQLTDDVSFKIAPALYNYTGHGADTSQSGSLIEPGFFRQVRWAGRGDRRQWSSGGGMERFSGGLQ